MAAYIEREAAIKVIQDIINHYRECYVSNARAETAEWCLKKLKELPAADVVPVRHGRWIRREGFDYENNVILGACSKCDWEVKDFTNYCPNCGVRMIDPPKEETE